MHTYEDLSDFEIECKVVKALDRKVLNYNKEKELLVVKSKTLVGGFKPCSIPNHAWAIIIDNKLKISPYTRGNWMVARYKVGFPDIEVIDKNPLRAAMICFLKMKDMADKQD